MALVNPLFLQIAIIIQQNYLQREFNKVTSPLTPEELDQEKHFNQSFGKRKSSFTHKNYLFYRTVLKQKYLGFM